MINFQNFALKNVVPKVYRQTTGQINKYFREKIGTVKAFTEGKVTSNLKPSGQTQEESIIVNTKDNIKIITINKPSKKNAINHDMYHCIYITLSNAAVDKDVSIVVLTGTGDFYSSGHDFVSNKDISIDVQVDTFIKCIEAFITFPKILIAILNGPAIGVAVTTLPFCDFAFASKNAYFYTPFTKLGILAEACSTFTFPKLMGHKKAMEMLILNYKMSAKEAVDCGLINNVYENDELQQKAWNKIAQISNLPKDSVLTTKKLIKKNNMDELLKINRMEVEEAIRIRNSTTKQ